VATTITGSGVDKVIDGSITSTKIADGTIVNADINASAAIAGSKVDVSFGKVLQVVSNNFTAGISSTTTTTYTDLITIAITPTSATSKILMSVHVGSLYMNQGGTNQTNWRLARNGSTCTGQNTNYHAEVGRNETAAGTRMSISMQALDEPATTSSVTYSVQVKRHTGTGGIKINDTAGTTSIILMEIGA
jgi:hypothetical protein